MNIDERINRRWKDALRVRVAKAENENRQLRGMVQHLIKQRSELQRAWTKLWCRLQDVDPELQHLRAKTSK